MLAVWAEELEKRYWCFVITVSSRARSQMKFNRYSRVAAAKNACACMPGRPTSYRLAVACRQVFTARTPVSHFDRAFAAAPLEIGWIVIYSPPGK